MAVKQVTGIKLESCCKYNIIESSRGSEVTYAVNIDVHKKQTDEQLKPLIFLSGSCFDQVGSLQSFGALQRQSGPIKFPPSLAEQRSVRTGSGPLSDQQSMLGVTVCAGNNVGLERRRNDGEG